MVAISVYITIFVANMGGFLDKVVRADIELSIGYMIKGGWLKDVTDEAQRNQIIEQTRAAMQESAGLNTPLWLRSVRWLWKGMTLDWGTTRTYIMSGAATPTVRAQILDFLPRTLLVFGTANILLFFSSILIALSLSRKYGSILDRLVPILAPLAAAPSWVYGLILSFITIQVLNLYIPPFNKWPPGFQLSFLSIYLKSMLPAILAIFMSKFFQSIYAWRTIFLVNSSEDYVDVAKAKGLPDRMIERRYILRPLLPNIITNFILVILALWQEAIILEPIFRVAGIGQLFLAAVGYFDIGMIVALVVTFAYILAFTVFLLDIIYALVDPRVKIGGNEGALKLAARKLGLLQRFQRARQEAKIYRQPRPGILARTQPGSIPQITPTGRHGAQVTLPTQKSASQGWSTRLKNVYRTLYRYPGAAAGLGIIFVLVIISIYTILAYPYNQTTSAWRGDQFVWRDNPTYAQPLWVNWFRKDPLPTSVILNSRDPKIEKTYQLVSNEMGQISFTFSFDYHSYDFPQEIILYMNANYKVKKPLLNLVWTTPDGRSLDLGNFSINSEEADYFFLDERLMRKLKTDYVDQGLFGDPNSQQPKALRGRYQLKITAFVFEENAGVNTKFVLYGKVWGIAGTDSLRRDVLIGLLWGTPIALSFGLAAAIFTTLTTLFIAATSVWFGGWVDSLIQRMTELNMILPMFPVILLVYMLYSKSFWVLLSVAVLLGIFGSGIKNFRSLFIQIKELPYFEAARAYGASDRRIIFRYLIPRIGPIIIPQLVILVPSYVFLEATLSVLGLYDPKTPPTWGQLIMDGLGKGITQGDLHLVVLPAFLLLLTGYSFLLLGISLERVFEPRLRER